MYDNAYESIDSPPDWVIEDDKLLDEYFEVLIEEYNERRENNYREKMHGKSSIISAYQSKEVFPIVRAKKKIAEGNYERVSN
jgi:hypothetical protein